MDGNRVAPARVLDLQVSRITVNGTNILPSLSGIPGMLPTMHSRDMDSKQQGEIR
ncbi:hypothetical protein GF325_06590 [Candidatus Bathyarchaeota archaeon]|nr:hypothetical protein [Candidatus Bathyarchaeota archaeon]